MLLECIVFLFRGLPLSRTTPGEISPLSAERSWSLPYTLVLYSRWSNTRISSGSSLWKLMVSWLQQSRPWNTRPMTR